MEVSGYTLKELWIASRWAKFMAIVGIIMYVITIITSMLSGIATAYILGTPNQAAPTFLPFGGFFLTLILIILYTLLIFVPSLILLKFGITTQRAIKNLNDDLLSTGIKKMRQYFQYAGIMLIITIFITALLILIGIISSIF
jgi:hypothetical protein